MARKERDYREEVKIDKFNLDKEWLEQADKFIDWGEQKAEAEYERDRAKEKLELIKAELSTKIRENPKQFGLDKVTEAGINDVILQNKKYQDASSNFIEATKNVKILVIVVQGFEQRKTALEEEVKLFLNGYWADPRSKIGTDFTSNAVGGAIKNKISETLRKRRIGKE